MTRFSFAGTSAAVIASATATLRACSDNPTEAGPQAFKGPQIAGGYGFACTEMVVGNANDLQELSRMSTEDALVNLPVALPNTEFVVPLPRVAPTTFYNRVGIIWPPQGHPPAAIYTSPYFDAP